MVDPIKTREFFGPVKPMEPGEIQVGYIGLAPSGDLVLCLDRGFTSQLGDDGLVELARAFVSYCDAERCLNRARKG